MITYSKRNVSIIALIITTLIFIVFYAISIYKTITQIKVESNIIYSKVYEIHNKVETSKISNIQIDAKNVTNKNTISGDADEFIKKIRISNIKDEGEIKASIENNDDKESKKNKNNQNKSKNKKNDSAEKSNSAKEKNNENEIATSSKNNSKTQTEVVQANKNVKWRIEIPKLNLNVHIQEGTNSAILLTSVGHFEETSKWNGNVALAAHNRGYKCNFFQEIKNLKKGDEIIYLTEKGKKIYKVKTNEVILETDWSYLQETEDNRITLITCEANRKEYRRCVQAVEVISYEINSEKT